MSEIMLDVPYYSQRDNAREPMRTCNVSSHAMACEFIKSGSFKKSDDFYAIALSEYGDTTNHSAHSRLLADRGFKSEFRTDLSYKDLDESLFVREMPVIIGVLHRGYYLTPYGGHMLVVIGRTGDDYICHDPWGEPFSYQNSDGKAKKIPPISLNHRWLVEGGKSGWGRLFYP